MGVRVGTADYDDSIAAIMPRSIAVINWIDTAAFMGWPVREMVARACKDRPPIPTCFPSAPGFGTSAGYRKSLKADSIRAKWKRSAAPACGRGSIFSQSLPETRQKLEEGWTMADEKRRKGFPHRCVQFFNASQLRGYSHWADHFFTAPYALSP